jgi:hypothetical protein
MVKNETGATEEFEYLSKYLKMFRDIDDETLKKMLAHLIPITEYNLDSGESFTFAHLENIKPKEDAYTWVKNEERKRVGILTRNRCQNTLMFSKWSFYGLFKPSLYEVCCSIYQWMGDDWKKVKYFWIDNTEQMGADHIIGDYQYARLILWTKHGLIDE